MDQDRLDLQDLMAPRGGLGLHPHTLGDPHCLEEVDLGVVEEEGKRNKVLLCFSFLAINFYLF